VKILIGYDGSESADAAIAAADELLAGADVEATVLCVWEPELVAAVRAARFGGPILAISNDAADDDDRSEQQARKLAEHGARLARNSGLDATAVWVADDRDVPRPIVGEASKLDVDLVVVGARGLTGVRAFLGSVSNHVLQHSRRPVLVVPASSRSKADPEPPAGVVTASKNGRCGAPASKPRTQGLGPQPT
jgi:nucleotide-binding universal stress UspA family protein